MAQIRTLCLPLQLLSTARYAAAPPVRGSSRPSGAGLNGVDIRLLWLLVAHALHAPEGVVTIPQTTLTAAFGRIHPDRVVAALDRLRGNDVFVGVNVMPAVVSHSRSGEGREARTWRVKLDDRLIQVATQALQANTQIDIPIAALKPLSSKYSVVLYGRFAAWKAREYPQDAAIGLLAHPQGRAFEMDVPLDLLPRVFGLYDALRPSEIERLLVTSKATCPLKRELGLASVAVDTLPLFDELSKSRLSRLHIRISDILTEGLADLNHAARHKNLRQSHWRNRQSA